jgi:hypothetical protein
MGYELWERIFFHQSASCLHNGGSGTCYAARHHRHILQKTGCRSSFCMTKPVAPHPKGPFISSCIDRFIPVAFPARQIFFSTAFISSCFNRFLHDSARSVSVWDLSDTLRVWTCRAGQQRKQTYSMNGFSVVFIHIQVHFQHGQWKIDWISTGVFIFVWFTGQKLLKNFSSSSISSLYRVQYSPSDFLLLSILWEEKRLSLRFSLFWIFSSSNKIDTTHNSSVDRCNMFTRRYGLMIWKLAQMSCRKRYVYETIDAGWYESTLYVNATYNRIYLKTNSMQHCPYWEANSRSGVQQIPRLVISHNRREHYFHHYHQIHWHSSFLLNLRTYYHHVSGIPWLIITDSGLDYWIYWRCYYNYADYSGSAV